MRGFEANVSKFCMNYCIPENSKNSFYFNESHACQIPPPPSSSLQIMLEVLLHRVCNLLITDFQNGHPAISKQASMHSQI